MATSSSTTIFSINDPKIYLAPMVRAGSLPFRSLALKYGADYVYSEEIIDRRVTKSSRVYNENLNTIDYIIPSENVIIFRTHAEEKMKVIFQLGTASPDSALEAAKIVENDVCGIDINMGCPKKFSIQGGMGAALLTNQENACNIVRTLSSNLSIPVSVKIRLLENIEATVSFMQRLQEAGAAAITVHLRTKTTSSNCPANWDALAALVRAVTIPVIANGDVYTIADAEYLIQTTGCAGAMIGRPALLNISLLTRPQPLQRQPESTETPLPLVQGYVPVPTQQVDCWRTLRVIINDFLEECVKYDPPFQIVKYTIQEMMSQRRHSQDRLKYLRKCGLNFGRMNDIYQTLSAAKSLPEMCEIFELPELAAKARLLLPCLPTKKRSRSEVVEGNVEKSGLQPDHRFDSSYFDEQDTPLEASSLAPPPLLPAEPDCCATAT